MQTDLFFSSGKDDWTTPQNLFDALNDRFHFTLDAAASDSNHKCDKYYTAQQNGLLQSWEGETVFINPPYGRSVTGQWVKKASEEHEAHKTTIVMLLPARTDTKWFHDFIYNKAVIYFIRGRLRFGDGKNSAPFPSMVVVWR